MSSRLLAPALLLAAVPALAATPVNETRPLAADGRVSIENLKGEVRVRTWDRPEVRITGSLGEGVEKLEVEGSASRLSIEVRYPQRSGGWFGWGGDDTGPTVLEVTLPRGASLDVDTVSADIDVEGVAGARLDLESVSGRVGVRAARPGVARVSSVSGGVEVEAGGPDVGVETVSGDIRLQGALDGRVSVETVSGDATVVAGALERLSHATVSGDARLEAGLRPGGSLRAESVSGTLEIILPAATSARLAVETFSGGISSPVGKVETEQYGPGKSLSARLGGGDGDIRLESFSGDVRIQLK